MSAADRVCWYLINCKPREDGRALEHLQRQGFECYLPTLQVEKLRGGRRVAFQEPLFPRYLFVKLDEINDSWYPIRSTRGVNKIVCCNGRAIPVPDAVIEGIRARLADGSYEKPSLKHGERVKITEGPFSQLEAIFVAKDGEERVVLLLNIMQTDQELSFPLQCVRRIA